MSGGLFVHGVQQHSQYGFRYLDLTGHGHRRVWDHVLSVSS
jgi:hypothetical protein